MSSGGERGGGVRRMGRGGGGRKLEDFRKWESQRSWVRLRFNSWGGYHVNVNRTIVVGRGRRAIESRSVVVHRSIRYITTYRRKGMSSSMLARSLFPS